MLRNAAWLVVLACLPVACGSSSSGRVTVVEEGGHSSQPEDAGSRDAKKEAACSSMPSCAGSVSGGVSDTITACSMSGEEGTSDGFAEVTFSFMTKTGVMGSGNISTTGTFKPGTTYTNDAGLWNDMQSSADSLWIVSWTGDGGAGVMAECNGVKSPDEIPSLCTGATVDITGVDGCHDIHGTVDVTVPAYMGIPAVTVQLSF